MLEIINYMIFEKSNGTVSKDDDTGKIYRGMPIGKENGKVVYSSARDIGNIAAGYVAGYNNLSWISTRVGFDGYQSWNDKKISFEGKSFVNAQFLGWTRGVANLTHQPVRLIRNMILINIISTGFAPTRFMFVY